jgi:hypothetical protein
LWDNNWATITSSAFWDEEPLLLCTWGNMRT